MKAAMNPPRTPPARQLLPLRRKQKTPALAAPTRPALLSRQWFLAPSAKALTLSLLHFSSAPVVPAPLQVILVDVAGDVVVDDHRLPAEAPAPPLEVRACLILFVLTLLSRYD